MWELPVGKSRAYLSKGLLSEVIGNWQLSGITVFQSSVPLRITASDTTGLLDCALNAGRGNRLCNPVLPNGQRTTSAYFNTACFATAPPFTMPTDSLTQPQLRDYGCRSCDVSLIRNHPFKERYNLQFRVEAFNAFNTLRLSLGKDSSVAIGNAQFGKVLSGADPRRVTLGLRFLF
ncbi:MAG: hypothetical protein M1541_08260 [Acidobacteria bacterium]|nr:hypothetical protein [Acidobacteriota bacterium]